MQKKLPMRLVVCLLCICAVVLAFAIRSFAQTKQIPTDTYPIYGGWNDYNTYADGWTAGSDNVVWDFANKEPVYRQTNSLSLKYNPKGEFHMTTQTPLNLSKYKWLSFTGRAEHGGLDFGLTFTDANNNPVGNTLKFSDNGGETSTDYWTQY